MQILIAGNRMIYAKQQLKMIDYEFKTLKANEETEKKKPASVIRYIYKKTL